MPINYKVEIKSSFEAHNAYRMARAAVGVAYRKLEAAKAAGASESQIRKIKRELSAVKRIRDRIGDGWSEARQEAARP